MRLFILVFIAALSSSVRAWDDDDYHIFDLVEEINQNFYKFMGIEQVCHGSQIATWMRNFRNLSLCLVFRTQQMPKSNEPSAASRFNSIPTRIPPKMPTFSSAISSAFTKHYVRRRSVKPTIKCWKTAYRAGVRAHITSERSAKSA